MLHRYTFNIILLLVNFSLPGDKLVTSTVYCAVKGWKMEEVCKISHKKL